MIDGLLNVVQRDKRMCIVYQLGGPALRAGAPRLAQRVLMQGFEVERDRKDVGLRSNREECLFKTDNKEHSTRTTKVDYFRWKTLRHKGRPRNKSEGLWTVFGPKLRSNVGK
jgi:hypothetical protein